MSEQEDCIQIILATDGEYQPPHVYVVPISEFKQTELDELKGKRTWNNMSESTKSRVKFSHIFRGEGEINRKYHIIEIIILLP
jgi:hypothetical protein